MRQKQRNRQTQRNMGQHTRGSDKHTRRRRQHTGGRRDKEDAIARIASRQNVTHTATMEHTCDQEQQPMRMSVVRSGLNYTRTRYPSPSMRHPALRSSLTRAHEANAAHSSSQAITIDPINSGRSKIGLTSLESGDKGKTQSAGQRARFTTRPHRSASSCSSSS